MFRQLLKTVLPVSVYARLRMFYRVHILRMTKYQAELEFWKKKHTRLGGTLASSGQRDLMLQIASETDERFLDGAVVADFGCGPVGSLSWLTNASWRIGIDILADSYAEEFRDDFLSYGMVYLKSTETIIPLPSGCVDCVFSVNAFDHVDNLVQMKDELLRILKPGGLLLASFNLNEKPTITEPQKLTSDVVRSQFLQGFDVVSARTTKKTPNMNELFLAGEFQDGFEIEGGGEGALYVKATKSEQ